MAGILSQFRSLSEVPLARVAVPPPLTPAAPSNDGSSSTSARSSLGPRLRDLDDDETSNSDFDSWPSASLVKRCKLVAKEAAKEYEVDLEDIESFAEVSTFEHISGSSLTVSQLPVSHMLIDIKASMAKKKAAAEKAKTILKVKANTVQVSIVAIHASSHYLSPFRRSTKTVLGPCSCLPSLRGMCAVSLTEL